VTPAAPDTSGTRPAPHQDSLDTSSIARTLAIVGDRWSFLILRSAFRGIHRFDDFQEDLGIGRGILADRLRKLVEAGVLCKVQYQDRPPRFDYRLTPRGWELSPALVALMFWGDKHLADEAGPSRVLVHKPCGTEFEQGFWCARCGRAFKPIEIGSRRAAP
jgi:DNA-binding HxlR family transcriptional regulator